MVRDTFSFRKTESTVMALRILLSTLPVLVVGLFFKDKIEKSSFYRGAFHCRMDVITHGSLFCSCHSGFQVSGKNRAIPIPLVTGMLFLWGIAQAFAVFPVCPFGSYHSHRIILGRTQRQSGSIFIYDGVDPLYWENHSEIVSGGFAPAVTGLSFSAMAIGFLAAFTAGLLACKLMIAIVRKVRFTWFAVYCLLVGLACLLVPLL